MHTLDAAHRWHHLGIATIPCCARSKRPALDSWRRYQSELPTMRQLGVWFDSGGYNLAVVTGWRGLVVLDWDDVMAYSRWIMGLDAEVARMVARTYRVATSRGVHLYFYAHEETQCTKGDGWDVKAGGGYVLGAPSVHPTGASYVASGDPGQIVEIASIWDLIEQPAPFVMVARSAATDDPFDAAMRPDGPSTSIEDVKARYSVAKYFGLGASSRYQMARCPFHNDNHPSLAVYPDDHWHCYVCQAHGGDYLDFYARLKGVSIRDALRELA